MRFPGKLIPFSAKAIFISHISAAGESDSIENELCASITECVVRKLCEWNMACIYSFWCSDDYEQDSQGAGSSTNNQLLCFIVRVCLPVHQGVSPVTYEHKRYSVMRIEEINGQSVIEGLKEASRESYELGLTDKKRNQRWVLLRHLVCSKTMRVKTCWCVL